MYGEKTLELVLHYVVVNHVAVWRLSLSELDSALVLACASASQSLLTFYGANLAPLLCSHGNRHHGLRHAARDCDACQLYGTSCLAVNLVRLYSAHQSQVVRDQLIPLLWQEDVLLDLTRDATNPASIGVTLRIVSLLLRLDIHALPDVVDSQLVYAIGQLHDSILQQSQIFEPVKLVLRTKRADLYQALGVAQRFYDTVRVVVDTLASSLETIHFTGTKKSVMAQVFFRRWPADIHLDDDLMAYVYELFLDEPTITRFLSELQSDRLVDARNYFVAYCKARDSPLTWTRKLAAILTAPSHRTDQEVAAALRWLRSFDAHRERQSPAFRCCLAETVLRCLIRPPTQAQYIGASVRAIIALLPRVERGDLIAIDGALNDFAHAALNVGMFYDTVGDIKKTVSDWLCKSEATVPENVVTPPPRPPLEEMTLDELCVCFAQRTNMPQDWNGGYERAFQLQFVLIATSDEQTLHRRLFDLTKLIKCYAAPALDLLDLCGSPLPALTPDMRQQYTAMLCLFLADIELSVAGVRAQCACCGKDYATCVETFAGVAPLVGLDKETTALLSHLSALSLLPQIEEACGLVDQETDAVEPVLDDDDDSTELGHFHSSDEEEEDAESEHLFF